MAEVLQGGVPTDSSSVKYWNYSNLYVISNPTYGLVYLLKPAGYMTQFVYVSGVMSQMHVIITYEYNGVEALKCNLVAYDAHDNNVCSVVLLNPSDGFISIDYVVTLDDMHVTKVALEIINDQDANIELAGISVDCSIATESNTIDTTEFIQGCIMFGSDVNKPALR